MTPAPPNNYTFQQVRSLPDGKIVITMARTWEMHGTSMTVTMASTVTAAELAWLEALAVAQYTQYRQVDPDLWQFFLAAGLLCGQQADLPPELKRFRVDAMLKLGEGGLAKIVHAFVEAQLRDASTQTPAFQRALKAIRETLDPEPRALTITAWLVEHHLGVIAWDEFGLRRPTKNVDRFADEYIYGDRTAFQSPEALKFAEFLVEAIVERYFPS